MESVAKKLTHSLDNKDKEKADKGTGEEGTV
jgi:hypothetical protein